MRKKKQKYSMSKEQRLVLWACSFVIFDYLRCRKQLRPKVNGFDTNVKKIINDTIQKLLSDDEHRGDKNQG